MRTTFITTAILALATSALLQPVRAASAEIPKPATKTASGLTLADKGVTSYVIALADDAIPAETTAANELRDYLKQISGANFAVKNEKDVSAAQPQILVGAGTRVKSLLPGQKWEVLENDGILIKSSGKNLILAGGRPRGTLYAVNSFLENALGVRWWTPEASFVPRKSTVQIPLQNTLYTPALKTRETAYNSIISDHKFAVRMKNNGHWEYIKPELGGHNSILGWCHTFASLLPVDKYFKDHPEWYSDSKTGLPCTKESSKPGEGHGAWQLNLTNEEARKELTKNALEWIRADPSAGIISISQNDYPHPCRSPEEVALQEKEGSASGPLLHFVNKVAEEIEKEFPDFLVETLAYQHTQKPPKFVKPRHNVVIRLCTIDADFARPLDNDSNARFREDAAGWKAIAPRLYFWDYVVNFANKNVPHPNLNVLGPNIKFFVDHKAIGLFEQGDAETSGTTDFAALRTWLISQLMWNPNQDQKKLENEFLKGYYGAAAPYLRGYLDAIQKSFGAHNKEAKLGSFQADYSFLTLDVMTNATRAFNRAEAAVGDNPTLLDRVQRERITLDNAWLLRYRILQREAQLRKVPFEGPADPVKAVADFGKLATKYKLETLRYNALLMPVADYEKILSSRFSAPSPLPAFAQGKPAGDIIDVQENAFRIIPTEEGIAAVDDDKASNGRTARLTSNHFMWSIQYPIEDDAAFLKNGPWRVYAALRVQPKEGAAPGKVLTFGLYDEGNKVEISKTDRTLEETGPEYKYIDLGTYSLTPSMYFWFAPNHRADIEGIYIDRLVMIRETKKP